MNEESSSRIGTKRRIAKGGGGADDRQMVISPAGETRFTTSDRRVDPAVAESAAPDDIHTSSNGAPTEPARAMGKVFAIELKSFRKEISDEQKARHKELSDQLRVHHQALSDQFGALQLEILATLKGSHSAIAKRLDVVLAVVEHDRRLASVTPKSQPTLLQRVRIAVVVGVAIVVTGLAVARCLDLL